MLLRMPELSKPPMAAGQRALPMSGGAVCRPLDRRGSPTPFHPFQYAHRSLFFAAQKNTTTKLQKRVEGVSGHPSPLSTSPDGAPLWGCPPSGSSESRNRVSLTPQRSGGVTRPKRQSFRHASPRPSFWFPPLPTRSPASLDRSQARPDPGKIQSDHGKAGPDRGRPRLGRGKVRPDRGKVEPDRGQPRPDCSQV